MTIPPEAAATSRPRSAWRSVVIPNEHGGWGLTSEPVLLGLLIAPSVGGLALGMAAFGAFLVRTPLKLVFVDRRRHRWLDRSRLALLVAAIEIVMISVLVAIVVWRSGSRWIIPVAIAVPLVAVELWFDIRSHGRRLVPELCGALGIAAVAPAIVMADGRSGALASAVWLVLAARVLGSIPHVRVQIMRLRRGLDDTRGSDLAQLAAVVVAVAAVVVDRRLIVGSIAIVSVVGCHIWWVRRPAVAAKTVGLREMALGFTVVLASAAGVVWL
jgi:hypothetical protein